MDDWGVMLRFEVELPCVEVTIGHKSNLLAEMDQASLKAIVFFNSFNDEDGSSAWAVNVRARSAWIRLISDIDSRSDVYHET